MVHRVSHELCFDFVISCETRATEAVGGSGNKGQGPEAMRSQLARVSCSPQSHIATVMVNNGFHVWLGSSELVWVCLQARCHAVGDSLVTHRPLV